MALHNFQPPDLKRKRLKSRPVVWAIGIISMVSVAVVGFTLATPVTRNIVSSASEFGQGMTVTTGCAGSTPLALIPRATFRNTGSGAGSYYFTNDDTYTHISSASPTSFTIDWDDSGGCGGPALVDPASLSKIVVQTSSDCS